MADARIDTAGALRTLQAFIDANARGDHATMSACLCRNSLDSGDLAGANPDAVYTLGIPVVEGDRVVIPMRLAPRASAKPSEPDGAMIELPAIMTLENGAWKLDLASSQDRMMTTVNEAMHDVAAQVGDAFAGAMESISAAFDVAFGDDSDAPSWTHVTAEPESHELWPQPNCQPLERIQKKISDALGFPVSVQANLYALLSGIGDDNAPAMQDWLEEQLLVNWPEMLANIAASVPLAARFHGIRIEAAPSADDRLIVADLNQVLYRLTPRDVTGFYTDEEAAYVLPGVLASMAEPINPASATMSIFGQRVTPMGVDEYAAVAGPRCMRHISSMLGHGVALEADWDSMRGFVDSGERLMRWGLTRVVGGVAIAQLDRSANDTFHRELRIVRLRLAASPATRTVSYADGVLTFAPALEYHEAGCIWEAEVAAALRAATVATAGTVTVEATPGSPTEDADDEAVTNDTLFRDAIASLESAVPAWRMQLELIFNRSTPITVDWDSLGGDYGLVNGMVHIGVVESLNAITVVAFDPAYKDRLGTLAHSVRIQHAADMPIGRRVSLDGCELNFHLDASRERHGPPDNSIANELRALLDSHLSSHTPAEPAAVASSSDRWSRQSRSRTAITYMDQLEAAMRAHNLWPGEPPEGPLEVVGAFGCENMPFEHWLAWVLIPRVKSIAASGGDFPSASAVGAYAIRALDGTHANEVINVLSEFDSFIGNSER